jgi:hypothetical protein
MEKHLARISDLLRKQQEQKSIREKEADYRRPFEQAAKASMEGVSSGSLIVRTSLTPNHFCTHIF